MLVLVSKNMPEKRKQCNNFMINFHSFSYYNYNVIILFICFLFSSRLAKYRLSGSSLLVGSDFLHLLFVFSLFVLYRCII